jgi:hypothetical protein
MIFSHCPVRATLIKSVVITEPNGRLISVSRRIYHTNTSPVRMQDGFLSSQRQTTAGKLITAVHVERSESWCWHPKHGQFLKVSRSIQRPISWRHFHRKLRHTTNYFQPIWRRNTVLPSSDSWLPIDYHILPDGNYQVLITRKSASQQRTLTHRPDLYRYGYSFRFDFLMKRSQSELSNTMWLQTRREFT